MYEAPQILPMFAAYYIFNSMLLVLLGLHVFWTYFILKVIVKALKSGRVRKVFINNRMRIVIGASWGIIVVQVDDARSSTESEGEDET